MHFLVAVPGEACTEWKAIEHEFRRLMESSKIALRKEADPGKDLDNVHACTVKSSLSSTLSDKEKTLQTENMEMRNRFQKVLFDCLGTVLGS